MKKCVFLFPGQGSQEVGMARDLFSGDDYFLSLIAHASALTGEDLKVLCLKGPEKKLANARFLQPLLVAVSLGYLRHVNKKGIKANYFLGHSLGEITALAAAGVISDTTALAVAVKRGELMDAQAASHPGGMAAVACGVPEAQALIKELGLGDKVFISNINAPDQLVLSADQVSLGTVTAQMTARGIRCKKLNVAGPWHSPYLVGAYERFQVWAQELIFHPPQVPIIFNTNARPDFDPKIIKQFIAEQMKSPVHFKQCLEYLRGQAVDVFLEIGSGRVLSGLVRANGFMQGVSVFCVNDLRGVDNAARELLI